MKLNFLGCGSAWCPELGNTSAWFLDDDTLFLLDCGETVFQRIHASGVLDNIRKAVIMITHMHADHCGSLPTLVAYLYYRSNASISIVHPDTARIKNFLDTCGASPESWNLSVNAYKSKFGTISIEPCPVRHVGNMNCYGYVVSLPDDSFFYSGDSAQIPVSVLERFLNGEIHHLYIDTCVDANNDHGELSRHLDVIPPELRNRVTCMHLNPKDFDTIRKAGFQLACKEEK